MSVYAETKLGINYIVVMSASGSEDIVWDGVIYPDSSDQAQYTCPRGDDVEHERPECAVLLCAGECKGECEEGVGEEC